MTIEQQITRLRDRIIAAVPRPALITMCCARHEQGALNIAISLAEKFAASGHRALLIDCHSIPAAILSNAGGRHLGLDLEDFDLAAAHERGVETAATLRGNFDFVFMYPGELYVGSLAAVWAELSDGVLPVVITGRKLAQPDFDMRDALASLTVPTLGFVVASSASMRLVSIGLPSTKDSRIALYPSYEPGRS